MYNLSWVRIRDQGLQQGYRRPHFLCGCAWTGLDVNLDCANWSGTTHYDKLAATSRHCVVRLDERRSFEQLLCAHLAWTELTDSSSKCWRAQL